MKNALSIFYLLFTSLILLLSISTDAQIPFGVQEAITPQTDGVRDVHSADIDGDGDLDLLSASFFDNKIAWYENEGNGEMGEQQMISSEAFGARDVYADDLDGDGDLDVLSASYQDDKIAWYENDGNGNFGPQLIITTDAAAASSVYTADLDGDGDPDVLSASFGDGKIAWYENDGSGDFGTEQTIIDELEGARFVYAADLDGDGDPEVLSASWEENVIAWYLNDGAGHFSVPFIISDDLDSAILVYASDFDLDGDLDVLSYSDFDDKIAWYENDGNINFGPQQIIGINTGAEGSIYPIDLDSDGDSDILYTSGVDEIGWYENDGNGVFDSTQIISSENKEASAIYATDIDSDGDMDVFYGSWINDEMGWYENDGDTNFEPVQLISLNTEQPRSVYSADIDGDNDLDVLSASYQDDKIAWYENDGTGEFGAQKIISAEANGAWDVYSVDLDGDADMDVLSASTNDDKIAWYENDGNGNFGTEQIISLEADKARSIYSADLDSDGDQDVLSASWADDKIAWYENDGNGNFGAQQIISLNADKALSVYSEDLDGDGDFDVLSASLGDGKIAWYENDGNGNFGAEQILSINATQARAVYSSDLDGDGDQDVLSASLGDDKIAWYENDGNGNFSPPQNILDNEEKIVDIMATDLDGDGDEDVLSISANVPVSGIADNIAWYENDGTGVFGPQQIISTNLDVGFAIYSADLNGDEVLDVLSASEEDNKIAWYQNLLALNMELVENNPTCVGSNTGSFQVYLSGLTYPPYSYEWSLDGGLEEGSGFSETANFTIDELAGGTYDLMVINSVQDTVIQEGIILGGLFGSFFEIVNINTANSTNEFPNASIEISVDGGIPDYTFSWDGPSNGSIVSNSSTEIIANLYAGNYSITITDSDNNSITQVVSLFDESVLEEVCVEPLDIVILNDVSGSVDAAEYEESKAFYVDFINSLNVGLEEDESRVAIVEWSDTDEQELVIPITGDSIQLQNYVNLNRAYDGGTNPNVALTYGYDYLEDEARESATKILVLSTDGTDNQVSLSLISLAEEYKAQGYVIVSIAFDEAYDSPITQAILQEVSSLDLLAPGADTYAELDQQLAAYIVNIYVCASVPGNANVYFFDRDGAVEIEYYVPTGTCSDFSSIDIYLTVTAQQQLSLPAGTPISFYYNNPALYSATPIITSFIPCAIDAGNAVLLNYNLPISGPANVWAVLNDDGSQSTPINFPITDIDEIVFNNNIDQIEVCVEDSPTISALKYTTTPQMVCNNTVLYTIDVCNISNMDAVGVEVTDIAPPNFELLNISIYDNACAIGEGPFDLEAACCVSITYEYDASAASAGVYNNQGAILSGPSDQVYIDFVGSTSLEEDVIIGEVLCDSEEVIFTKEVNINDVCEESFITYSFTIENQSNIPLQVLSFTDVLPDPVIWAGEPYAVENMSLGETSFTNTNEAVFTIAEIPSETIASFQIDAYLGNWEESADLENIANISNFPNFINGDGGDLSAISEEVTINSLPMILTEDEISVCILDSEISLSAEVFDGQEIAWVSAGDGEFSTADNAITTYTFGPADIEAGSVNMSISAFLNLAACGESLVSVYVQLEEDLCAECSSNAGEISFNTDFLCAGESVSVTTNNPVIDAGAELWYILHDSPTNEAGQVSASNQSGTFDLSAIDNILSNEFYYISALVGPANNGELPNLDDPCSVINEGTSIILLDEISWEYNEECDPISEIYTLTIQVNGGLAAYDSSESYSINGYYNDDDLSASETFQIIIDDVTDGTIIEFWATDALGCQGYESIVVECIKLPIELLSFTGNAREDGNLLQWQTAAEIDVSAYHLERSYDGLSFQTIAQIEARGNHSEYQFVDIGVDAYYRIAWEDGFSHIIQIKRSNIDINIEQWNDQLIIDERVESMELINMMGQQLLMTKDNYLYIGDMPNGVYLVKILVEGRLWVKKIIL